MAGMAKKILAVALILLTGGSWVYLDYRNKQEQAEAEEMHRAMAAMHAKALAKERAETQLANDLVTCRTAAKNANHDYINLHQKPVPRKPGQFTTPPAVADEAVKMLESAYLQCQQAYDARKQEK